MTERACAVCGTSAPPPYRPPPAEQAPDLDLRPGEPARSTLRRWIAMCRGCGACAPDLAALPASAAGVVRSVAYETLEALPPALFFLRWGMICEGAGQEQDAAEAALQAAWALDDAGDSSGAAVLRQAAARLWRTPESIESGLRLLDVLRRAGEFERAESLAADLPAMWPLDENSERILAFQRDRIAERDAGRHLLSSALRPPARTPHVAQGKRVERGGFWARLRGR